MELWLFFTIFGSVLFIPTTLILLLFNRFKNTIVVLIKQNGSLVKIVINNKILESGQITEVKGKKVKPIPVSKEEIYYGKWRRFIIKPELESKTKSNISDREIEEYLNNEDLIKLYLAGKLKDTLFLLLGIAIFCIIVAGFINGYLTNSKQCLSYDNSTRDFIVNSFRIALQSNITGV